MKKTIASQMLDLIKGGSGSGNFGHSGRVGERGGSSDEGGGVTVDVSVRIDDKK
jgi:hypothetical protein